MLNFVKFQNVFTHLGVLNGLGWMPTALRERTLKIVFVSEWVDAVWTRLALDCVQPHTKRERLLIKV